MTTVDDTPIKELLARLAPAIQADRCTLFVVDHEKKEVWSRFAQGLEIPMIHLPLSRGVVGYVARTGRSVTLRDAYNDPRFDRSVDQQTGYRTKSILCMAVRDSESRVIGVLQALNKAEGTFSTEDEATMQGYCAEAAPLLPAP